MKKSILLSIMLFAISFFAFAQTPQVITRPLMLKTVANATASDTMVLVQGVDKIVRKMPLSSISGSSTNGNFIPLTGTDSGSPLTGRIEFASDPSTTFASSLNDLVIGAGNAYNLDEDSTIRSYTQYNYNGDNALARLSAENVAAGLLAQVSVVADGENGVDYVEINTSSTGVGLVGNYDYSANATDNAYVQKSYVNNATVNSTTYYNAGGNISLINDTTGDLSVMAMGVKLAELGYSGLTLYKSSGSVNANIASSLLTSSRSYQLPNANGTLAAIGTNAPASATATGSVGEIRVTSTYIYVCTATNTWVRAPLATW